MRTTILLLIALVLLTSFFAGCVSVNAPEKVEVQADAGKWNNVADKYASKYAGSDRSRHDDKHEDDDGHEDDDEEDDD